MLPIYNSCNMVLRKTKSFNKSRYSRNRQYYRTGVFLCLWANIIFVIGSYYAFFRLTFKFSYIFIILLITFSLILFSYFSRNFTIGILKSAARLVNYISISLVLYTMSLALKLKVLFKLYSIELISTIILSLRYRVPLKRTTNKASINLLS